MHSTRTLVSSAVIIIAITTSAATPAVASAQKSFARGSVVPGAARVKSDSVLNISNSPASTPGSDEPKPAGRRGPVPTGPHGAGLSGKVYARFLLPQDWLLLASLPGDEYQGASRSPATMGFQTVFTMRSFGQKVRASLNGYKLGYWPAERGRVRSEAYRNPDGFVEVTRENEDTRVSEHFRLRDFVSHGQANVWPKYVVIREPLLDKLELVIQELNSRGINAEGMRIRSGFRTPAHNSAVRGEGSARDSRHQFGDAVDVFIDQEGTGRMSDLNGDGRVNFADVKLILDAVERVEAKYPELVGGTGLYAGRSGSFAHIDVRGTRARWVRGVRRPRSGRYASSRKSTAKGGKAVASRTAVSSRNRAVKAKPAKRATLKTASAAPLSRRTTAMPR
ncbi:MAG TPA: D-Ala-D-Ala carboxypeptidase family metallohydrolase [Gemmatimonadaceae bacterium]|nr:D-Ala-D-Ala carboxypeptidase family metallohydrolase [Gemmatimonadaceae bacterium]